jgi:phospholipid/cholesterol/gamma-HCH transport system substrate-binding protein
MMRKESKNILKVGIFISSMLLVLMIMVVSIGKEKGIFSRKTELRGRIANVNNLRPGSFVELKGIRIGTVNEINIVSEQAVEIRFTVLQDKLQWIKQDSKIVIATAGLVGDKFLEVTSGSADAPVVDPATDVLTAESGGGIQEIIGKGESIASTTEKILLRIDHLLQGIEDGKKIAKIIDGMEKSSANLELITGELSKAGMADTVKNINASMLKLSRASTSLEQVLKRIEQGPGTMNSMIFDDSLHEDLRALLGGAQRNKVIKYFIRQSIKDSERKNKKIRE